MIYSTNKVLISNILLPVKIFMTKLTVLIVILIIKCVSNGKNSFEIFKDYCIGYLEECIDAKKRLYATWQKIYFDVDAFNTGMKPSFVNSVAGTVRPSQFDFCFSKKFQHISIRIKSRPKIRYFNDFYKIMFCLKY